MKSLEVLNKQYTYNKQKGNKGAARLEYELTDFVLMHRVDESKDLGNDFICELVDKEAPTRILFFIQCKAYKDEPMVENDKKTIGYWKEFDIPVYVFWVKDNSEIWYKRLTPFLHKGRRHKKQPFVKFDRRRFTLDLFIDTIRCFNRRGLLPGIDIKKYISDSWDKAVFNDNLVKEYNEEIKKHAWVGSYLLGVLYSTIESKENQQKSEECFRFALKHMPKQVPYDSKEYDFFVEYAFLVMKKELGEI